jgi:soluble lytic murein transglycosylase-like protein
MIRTVVLSVGVLALVEPAVAQDASRAKLDALIASHAQANGVPVSLVHRVVLRESRYRPGAIGKGGAVGLMQIKLATARGLGYTGTAQGLLDADTNLKYAVRYLAGAYRVARGNHDRAVTHYARGYYYAAKGQGMLNEVAGPSKQEALEARAESRTSVSSLANTGAGNLFDLRRDGAVN